MVLHVRDTSLRGVPADEKLTQNLDAGLDAFSSKEVLPPEHGCFTYDYVEFLPGCSITALNFTPKEDVVADISPFEGVAITCMAEGAIESRLSGAAEPIRYSDKHAVLSGPRTREAAPAHLAGGRDNRLVRLVLSHHAFQQWLVAAKISKESLETAELDPQRGGVIAQFMRSADMQMVLNQILTNQLEGGLRVTYLQGKALEFLSLFFRDLSASINPIRVKRKIGPAEQYRLQKARHIILDNLADAPTIPELAKTVMLSETALKSGFKALYGTTVYSFLLEHRMEKARELLLTGNQSVLSAAIDVGYSCPSRFAIAFKKRFGVSPGVYRRQSTALGESDTIAVLPDPFEPVPTDQALKKLN